MSKPSIWWFASGEYKKLSPSANSTRSSTEWGQDIKTTPNKTSTRLYGTKTKWKNSPLAIPNNSTIFAHTILSYFSTPCPLSTRLGAFSYPETFSRKFFPKFFPIRPRRLFSGFLVRKIMGAKGTCRSLNGGGCPFLYAIYIANSIHFVPCSSTPPAIRNGESVALVCFLLLEFCTPWVLGYSKRAKGYLIRGESGKNMAKVNIYLRVFVSPRENRRPK